MEVISVVVGKKAGVCARSITAAVLAGWRRVMKNYVGYWFNEVVS